MGLSIMKIAVLYIALGRYTVFWDDFYQSSEKHFVREAEKEYFVFTDAEHLNFDEKENVHLIPQCKKGWPFDTLMRYEMFLQIEKQLEQADYIFFFNGNSKFFRKISAAEILPDDEHDGLVAATFDWSKEKFTYERNPLSTAYISEGEGRYYFRGGVNGGKTVQYLQMIKTLNQNIKQDLEKNIIALWHDESHINRYLLDKNPLVLSHYYCFDGAKFINPFRVKIIMQDKSSHKFGGMKYLRGEAEKPVTLRERAEVRIMKFICPFIPIKKLRKKVRNFYRGL